MMAEAVFEPSSLRYQSFAEQALTTILHSDESTRLVLKLASSLHYTFKRSKQKGAKNKLLSPD